jgi:hypothetical protein
MFKWLVIWAFFIEGRFLFVQERLCIVMWMSMLVNRDCCVMWDMTRRACIDTATNAVCIPEWMNIDCFQ